MSDPRSESKSCFQFDKSSKHSIRAQNKSVPRLHALRPQPKIVGRCDPYLNTGARPIGFLRLSPMISQSFTGPIDVFCAA